MNNQEPQSNTLKVSSKFWAEAIGLLFFLGLFLPFLAIFYFGQRFYLISGFCLLFAIHRFWINVKFAQQSYIAYSPTKLSGYLGRDFSLGWDEIKAVQFLVQGQDRVFLIFTENATLSIDCASFDEQALQNILQTHLPASVFEEIAYQNMIKDVESKNIIEGQFLNLPRPLKVSLDRSGVLVGILFFMGGGVILALLYFFNKLQAAWVLPFILCSFGLLLVISTGSLEATNEKISMYTRFHQYHFAWRDIREIYITPSHQGIIALVGDHYRFIVPEQLRWSGEDKWQLASFINYKLAESKIEPIKNNRIIYYWRSKNAPE